MQNSRSSFTGKLGFVLAAAGSAVGLGNIWRFPYLAAKYGGGIFLLVYLILSVTFGFSLMIAEIAIGMELTFKGDIVYRMIGVLQKICREVELLIRDDLGEWLAVVFVDKTRGLLFAEAERLRHGRDGYIRIARGHA